MKKSTKKSAVVRSLADAADTLRGAKGLPPQRRLIAPVRSINELRNLAATDHRYNLLALLAASNLGGDAKTLPAAIQWLEWNAMETTEEGVVGEINFCRDLVES